MIFSKIFSIIYIENKKEIVNARIGGDSMNKREVIGHLTNIEWGYDIAQQERKAIDLAIDIIEKSIAEEGVTIKGEDEC